MTYYQADNAVMIKKVERGDKERQGLLFETGWP